MNPSFSVTLITKIILEHPRQSGCRAMAHAAGWKRLRSTASCAKLSDVLCALLLTLADRTKPRPPNALIHFFAGASLLAVSIPSTALTPGSTLTNVCAYRRKGSLTPCEQGGQQAMPARNETRGPNPPSKFDHEINASCYSYKYIKYTIIPGIR